MIILIRIMTLYAINFLIASKVLPQELAEQILVDPEAMLALEVATAGVLTLFFTWLAQWGSLIPVLMSHSLGWAKNKLGVTDDRVE